MVYLAKWIRLVATGCFISLPLAAACGEATSESPVPHPFEASPASQARIASPSARPAPVPVPGGIQPAPTPASTSTSAASSRPANVPIIPGGRLLISVIDEQGQAVQGGTVEASIKHADFPEQDFQDSFDPAAFEGLIHVGGAPEDIRATVSFWVVTPDGRITDTVVIRNDEYAFAVADAEIDFVGVHEFDLGKTGQTTNLKLVTIDIKPDADPNCVSLSSESFIPVVILSTRIFDAADVDQKSLTLEGATARFKGKSANIWSFEDVDGDGDIDLVVRFPTADLQLTQDDTAAVMEGLTVSGTPIQAVDAVCLVP